MVNKCVVVCHRKLQAKTMETRKKEMRRIEFVGVLHLKIVLKQSNLPFWLLLVLGGEQKYFATEKKATFKAKANHSQRTE